LENGVRKAYIAKQKAKGSKNQNNPHFLNNKQSINIPNEMIYVRKFIIFDPGKLNLFKDL